MAGRASHIAIVLPEFSSGGTERTAIRFAGAWEQRGRHVTMLCGSERGPARALLAPGIRVLSPQPQVADGPLYRIRLARSFARLAAPIDPDLVFGIGNFHVPVLAIMRSALGKRAPPLVCRLSNRLRRPELDPVTQAAFLTAFRFAARRVDALVAMSDALAQEARAALDREDVGSIAEPNLPEGYLMNQTPQERQGPPLVVCAGRLEPQKRFERALRAFAALSFRRDARLIVLGEGSKRSALEREAKRLGIDGKVEFAGYVPDVQPVFERAQVFLCTSDYEGFPAVLVEAIAAGMTVVTTDCSPAIAEIMCDPSFGRVTGQDPTQIAEALEAALAAPGPDLAARKGLVARHRLGAAADAYLDMFDRVVADSRARRQRESAGW